MCCFRSPCMENLFVCVGQNPSDERFKSNDEVVIACKLSLFMPFMQPHTKSHFHLSLHDMMPFLSKPAHYSSLLHIK